MTCSGETIIGQMFLSDGQKMIYLIDIGRKISSRNVGLCRY